MITEERYLELVGVVNNVRPLYMQGAYTGISDEVYDSYMAEIYEYEEKHTPVANSPTKTVNPTLGGDVVHPIPMLSLKDVFTVDDTQAYCNSNPGVEFIEELKMDGLSIQLIYEGGQLVSASTRGNGKIGVEVLPVVKYMDEIPKAISESRTVIVHGEIFMRKSRFEEYCKVYGRQENPRNTAVGVLKRKTELNRGAYLSFYAFNLDNAESLEKKTHEECREYITGLGLPWVPGTKVTSAVSEYITIEQAARDDRDEPIDGLVFKMNYISMRSKLGDNGVIPKWAVAYKFPAQEQETRLKAIEWQVGATGGLTPVAILDPVSVMGSTITKATLHHKKRVQDLGLQIGDMVVVYKAGDIIPAIKSTRHTDESVPVEFPTECPACGTILDDNMVCTNIRCREKLLARLNGWTDKKVGNFKGVAGSLVTALYDRGKVTIPSDFYKVKGIDILTIPGSGKAKVSNYLKRVEESKKTMTFAQVLVGLGINNLAQAGAAEVEKYMRQTFPGTSWDKALSGFRCLSLDTLQKILGTAKGSSVFEQLSEPLIKEIIQGIGEVFKDRIL